MATGELKLTRSACQGFGCHEHCVLDVWSKDGKIVATQKGTQPGPGTGPHICSKGILSGDIPYAEDRILYPLKRVGERGEAKFERISWDQALTEITDKLKEITDKYGTRSVLVNAFWCGVPGADRSLNYDLALRFINSFGATRLEMPSVDVGILIGAGADMGQVVSNNKYLINDVDNMLIIWGSNPIGFTRPGETTHMMIDAKERGAKIVHVSNLFDVTSAKADTWIPVNSGTDGALAMAMAHVLIEEGLCDEQFLIERTAGAYLVRDDNGQYLREADIVEGGDPNKFVFMGEDGEPHAATRFIGKAVIGALGTSQSRDLLDRKQVEEGKPMDVYGGFAPVLDAVAEVNGISCKTAFVKLREHLAEWTPEAQEAITGVPAETCAQFARDFKAASPASIFINCGFRYKNGGQSSRAVYLLAYLTGNVGKKGGTLLPGPLDYYPTTQLNVMPLWFPDFNDMHRGDYAAMTDILASFENPAEAPQQYKAFINPFANPLTNWPNKHLWREQFLPNIELFVAFDIYMSDTAAYADYLLPEATIFERYEWMNGPNECFTLCEPAIPPQGESKDCAQIWREIATRMGRGDDWALENTKEWCIFESTLPQSDGEPQMAYITEEEDPERAGELAPITFERLEKVKSLSAVTDGTPFDNFTNPSFPNKTGKIEFYNEGLAPFGCAMVNYVPTIIHDEAILEKYPLQFYPGRHKYFMQSQFVNIPEVYALASSTQKGVALNPVTAKERGLHEGDEVEVFNQRGCIRTTLHLREDIAPGMAHMWYSFKEHEYEGTDCPQVLATPLNTMEGMDTLTAIVTYGSHMRDVADNIPRAVCNVVEKNKAEVFWDSLCDVRKVEA